MIEFRIDLISKKYFVRWAEDDGFEQLYLIITPAKPVKMIRGGKLELDLDTSKYTVKIHIYKRMSQNYIALPSSMPSATYTFGLYENPDASGNPLKEQVGYLGLKDKMYVGRQDDEGDMVCMSMTCKYQIPHDLFWLAASDSPADIKFYLPPMKKRQEQFQTSCRMLVDAYERMEFCLDDKISDFIEISDS